MLVFKFYMWYLISNKQHNGFPLNTNIVLQQKNNTVIKMMNLYNLQQIAMFVSYLHSEH